MKSLVVAVSILGPTVLANEAAIGRLAPEIAGVVAVGVTGVAVTVWGLVGSGWLPSRAERQRRRVETVVHAASDTAQRDRDDAEWEAVQRAVRDERRGR